MFVEVFLNFPEGQASGHEVPSKNLVPVQDEHWLLAAPLHVRHSAWQASQVFVDVFSNLDDGQLEGQEVPSKYLVPVQERQSVLVEFVQLSHSAWHASQVFVEEFSNTLVATHAVGQLVPSKNLPFGQDEH